MSQIKEAETKLKKALGLIYDTMHPMPKAEISSLINQALAKLTEQPPAGDFTRRARLIATHCPSKPRTPMEKCILEACTRLDRSEASRKDLLTAFKKLAATFVGLPEGSIGGQAMKQAKDAIKKGD